MWPPPYDADHLQPLVAAKEVYHFCPTPALSSTFSIGRNGSWKNDTTTFFPVDCVLVLLGSSWLLYLWTKGRVKQREEEDNSGVICGCKEKPEARSSGNSDCRQGSLPRFTGGLHLHQFLHCLMPSTPAHLPCYSLIPATQVIYILLSHFILPLLSVRTRIL